MSDKSVYIAFASHGAGSGHGDHSGHSGHSSHSGNSDHCNYSDIEATMGKAGYKTNVLSGSKQREKVASQICDNALTVLECKIGSEKITINLETYQIKVEGKALELSYLEYTLLAFFLMHPNKTYSRQELLQAVWGYDFFGTTRTVDVHIRRIRAKLGGELAQHLKTLRSVGYMWDFTPKTPKQPAPHPTPAKPSRKCASDN